MLTRMLAVWILQPEQQDTGIWGGDAGGVVFGSGKTLWFSVSDVFGDVFLSFCCSISVYFCLVSSLFVFLTKWLRKQDIALK